MALKKVARMSNACPTDSGLLCDAAAWKMTAERSAHGLAYVAAAAAPAQMMRDATVSAGMRSM